MSDDGDSGSLHAASDGAVAGLHPDRRTTRLVVAPTTQAQSNTYRSAVFPIACFKLEDVRFDFDSSVLLPDVAREMPVLKSLMNRLTDSGATAGTKPLPPPLSIFGHTDPEGPDDYNKVLGGRRAAVLYGLLTRRTEVWEDIYSDGPNFVSKNGGDQWGVRSIQVMLNALPADPSVQPPPDPLAVDGQAGPATEAAIRRFQSARGLPASGTADKATRAKLFGAYMDLLCVDVDGKPWQVDPAAGFLGHNADPKGQGKADFQGCGEFNPLMLFSQSDLSAYDAAADHTQRDALNRQNRRVMTLVFRPRATVTTDYWPCPRANEPMTGCKDRFWSDWNQRRSNGPEQREYAKTKDTFACRFYDRMVRNSPCEATLPVLRIRLFDPDANPLVGAPYLVTTPQGTYKNYSNADADAVVYDVVVPVTCTVAWSRPPPKPTADPSAGSATRSTPPFPYAFEYELEVYVGIPESDVDEAARQRLSNLGYAGSDQLRDNVKAFQVDLGVHPSGEVDDIRTQLQTQHDKLCQPPLTPTTTGASTT
jgi:peptidoglycan hydrolase-like protein with peptidoglycan-binding domain